MNTEEIKHVRDLVLADMLNGNDKIINGSILRKLDEQLTIPVVVLQSEQLCDNPHCDDGIVDADMYGHPIYCQVCDKHN